MLDTILAIAGKPGLYRLVSRGNHNLIVESIDAQKRRMPVFAKDQVISLADIAMYTNTEEVPLADVLTAIQEKEQHQPCPLDYKKATRDELFAYLGEVLKDYDADRIYPADVKKLVQWYNILVGAGLDDFSKLRPTQGTNIDDRKSEE